MKKNLCCKSCLAIFTNKNCPVQTDLGFGKIPDGIFLHPGTRGTRLCLRQNSYIAPSQGWQVVLVSSCVQRFCDQEARQKIAGNQDSWQDFLTMLSAKTLNPLGRIFFGNCYLFLLVNSPAINSQKKLRICHKKKRRNTKQSRLPTLNPAASKAVCLLLVNFYK